MVTNLHGLDVRIMRLTGVKNIAKRVGISPPTLTKFPSKSDAEPPLTGLLSG